MKRFTYIILCAVVACTASQDKPVVKSIGELRQIMHQGQIEARANLDSLAKRNVYGLGAKDSLSGELLILNGNVFQSFVKNDSLIISKDPNTDATLMVYTKVTNWDTLTISNTTDLTFELEKVADTSLPFPFILIGKVSAAYHVINFNTKSVDFSRHKEGALNRYLENEAVTLLGFYATNAKGIYTHHDSNIHMHLITDNQLIMGHVDELDISEQNLKLLIPNEVRKIEAI